MANKNNDVYMSKTEECFTECRVRIAPLWMYVYHRCNFLSATSSIQAKEKEADITAGKVICSEV